MFAPYWLVKMLCVLCFILNSISIFLCLSALFLLIFAYFDLTHLFTDINESTDIQSKALEDIKMFNSSIVLPITRNKTAIATTLPPVNEAFLSSTTLSSTAFPVSDSDQHLPLITYLLFYLATAILGVLGAHTFYNSKKMAFLCSHAILLFAIICFNLIAWLEFRAYSPLSASPYEDSHLLLAALFDFIDLLVALCLITSLIMNRLYVDHKQRNSIGPIIENGTNSE